MKLSKAQNEVLAKMADGQKYCAHDLECSLNTLYALEGRLMIERVNDIGLFSFGSERIKIEWRIIGRKNENSICSETVQANITRYNG